ncbi:MAG: DegV family protein [bacterium]
MQAVHITYLDGVRLKRALIAGTRGIEQYKDQLNTINVFPVADSDTGTNMSGTMRALAAGIASSSERTLAAISRRAADSALTGARGNSGTILSQFFYGITHGIQDQKRLTTRSFSRVVRNAVDYTYDALSEPLEGTILTVLRAWADTLEELSAKTDDFARLFSESLDGAKEALQNTRTMLPSLRKARVVDAGALGFVHLIEGIVRFIERGKIREVEQGADPELDETPELGELDEDITFRYCTECIIEGSNIDHAALRVSLSSLGDSLIVAGSPQRAKMHIHTDDPEEAFRIAESWGTLSEQKADDMKKQYGAAHTPHLDVALVVDSSCDLPAEYLDKSFVHMVPVKVIFGDDSYVDKVALTPEHYYDMLRTRTDVIPSTSQPAPGEFEKVFSFLTGHFREVIYLGLSGALSGTLESARNGSERLRRRENVHIFDTRMATVGSALIARRVIEAIERGERFEQIRTMIPGLVARTRLLLTLPSLDALLRSGRLGRARGMVARLLGLRPILTLDAEGRVVKAAMVRGAQAGREKLIELVRTRLGDGVETDFAIGHVQARDTAEWFRGQIERYFRPARDVFVQDASPALATHTGFGTIALAYIEPAPQAERVRFSMHEKFAEANRFGVSPTAGLSTITGLRPEARGSFRAELSPTAGPA